MTAEAMTGGMITTVPTSVEEAKQLGKDLVQNEGGKMLSKMTGAPSAKGLSHLELGKTLLRTSTSQSQYTCAHMKAHASVSMQHVQGS